jgi:D-glycero-D-manno-heptose 1,7-bisphosphate phosphatase
MSNRAVFLDRDGTVIEEVNYLHRLEDLQVYPFSPEALHRLKQRGFMTVMVTNQSAVARGLLTEDELRQVHAALQERLTEAGGGIDAYYYCPHHPEAALERYRQACNCRKPKAGLILRAAEEQQIDLAASYVVGDRVGDIQAGHAAGCLSILVRTGYGRSAAAEVDELRCRGDSTGVPDHTAENLLEAAKWILLRG